MSEPQASEPRHRREPSAIVVPASIRPADGRFGSGPSRVRPESVRALAEAAPTWLGTSHRRAPVVQMVASVRRGVADLLRLPDGYEVLLGNGGTTSFWDAAVFGLIEAKSHHLAFGEFSQRFADAVAAAPHLDAPHVVSSAPGTCPDLDAGPGADVYALTHNETSTGVMAPLARPDGVDAPEALVLVDATSAAGGIAFNPDVVDVYYFGPQKCLAGDGGLWLAACSPAAIERIETIARSDRWAPPTLDLGIALAHSRKDQTYNTPALATLFLLDNQLRWINDNGGLDWSTKRCATSSSTVYDWAEASPFATPFVADVDRRSPVVTTIDLADDVDAASVNVVLRANGIVDTESYRKLGRNQLRIATFPAIDPNDITALTACIDYVVERLSFGP